jgi:hypothetical protein
MRYRTAHLPLLAIAALGFAALAAAQTPVTVAPPVLAKSQTTGAGQVPTPESFFGFRMGTDGQLADWPSIQKYFEQVASKSNRVRTLVAGLSTEGRAMMAAIVSAPENIRRLNEIQDVNRLLADPRRIVNDEQARALLRDQKVVVAIGCSIHASEIGASQTASELLYDLATSADPKIEAILKDVVLILFPSLNPDGHTMVVDWYRRTKGTPFEGGPMPWADHKYVGKDLDRDAFMLNMEESRTLARFFSREWPPQVFLSMHEVVSMGPRMFVPPGADPGDPNQDPLISREAGLLSGAMSLGLEADNRSGVISGARPEYFQPGDEDAAPLGRNTVCLRTEVASVKVAAPVQVAAHAIGFPREWPGGAWRLRDIVEYEMVAVRGLLTAASRYRDDLLVNFYTMGRRADLRGRREAPYAYIIPTEQFDPAAARKLVNLLVQGGVEVQQAQEPLVAGEAVYPAGTQLVLMAQPFRAYAKSLLEPQRYPIRRPTPDRTAERPRDVAGWTLPSQMGVRVDRVDAPFEVSVLSRLDGVVVGPKLVLGHPKPGYYFVDTKGSQGATVIGRVMASGLRPEWTLESLDLDGYRYPAGTMVVRPGTAVRQVLDKLARDFGIRVYGVKGKPPASAMLSPARTGLYRPWNDAVDEGWTRWLLEQFEFPFRTLRDADIRGGGLRLAYDVIILPSMDPGQMIGGNGKGTMPEQYIGGLGEAGVAALKTFVEEGGTLVCLDASGQLAIDALKLPVRNALRDLPPDKFFCPGSLLRLNLESGNPLAFGIPQQVAAFVAFGAAYDVTDERSVRVVARYGSKDLLVSGWLEGESAIAGRPAVVEAQVGAGRAILIGVRAQHRGQTLATFRLLFNAIMTSGKPVSTTAAKRGDTPP